MSELTSEPVHLVRNVCDSCAVWCESAEYETGDHRGTQAPAEATCLECLKLAAAYGVQAHARLDVILIPSELCPECKNLSVRPHGGSGVRCSTTGCGYWFCY